MSKVLHRKPNTRHDLSGTRSSPEASVGEIVEPLIVSLLGTVPLRFDFWDGSSIGPQESSPAIALHSPDAITRILWSLNELGVGRAYVAGDIDIVGNAFSALERLRDVAPSHVHFDVATGLRALDVARRLGVIARPPAPPDEEIRPSGRLHSIRRDRTAISHHYDVSNDFYRLFLGPSMTYSCARFIDDDQSLTDAQARKHELICRKLGLHERPGTRLLDIGCGWGSLALHAARYHGARVVGVTISQPQMEWARQRVEDEGLANQIEIRLLDYRELKGERFDAVSSVGMFEHVGAKHMADYFNTVHALVRPGGRFLNHAISSVGGSRLGPRSFMARYVFPDGELIDVGDVVVGLENAGFEVRDVESLREHYALTLRQWVSNLEGNWADAVRLVGEARARVWRLYMAASAIGFEDGGVGIHQVLGIVPTSDGHSGMPSTRRSWE